METWKDISGYEGIYMISDKGRVKSLPRRILNYDGSTRVTKERILKSAINRDGYVMVVLCVAGRNKSCTIHRLVAKEFLPNIENKTEVNHKDGNKSNNNLSNLEWSTPSENQLHAIRNGLKVPVVGQKHGKVKLSEEDVVNINRQRASKSISELAVMYSVHRDTIKDILCGKTWSHLTGIQKSKRRFIS